MLMWCYRCGRWRRAVYGLAVLCCLPLLFLHGTDGGLTARASAQDTQTERETGLQRTLIFEETAAQVDTEFSDNDLYAISAVLMDADNGRVLYEKNGDEFRSNASTTKILTCILALEYGRLEDTVIVSSYAAKMPDVQLNIREGEEYRLRDLLYSMMLESHNDSAVAIAEQIGGSVEHFSEMMNVKAREIGCFDTYFITPNGLDAEADGKSHGTTAKDLARILKYCIMESPEKDTFLEITRTKSYSFSDLSGNRSFTCTNHNSFLSMMDGALTGKTGFTGNAGYCYVGALAKDGHTFIVALLGCGWPNNKTYKWQDTKKLMQYALNRYTEHTITEDLLQDMTVEVTGKRLVCGRTSDLKDSLLQNSAVTSVRTTVSCSFSDTLLLRDGEQVSVVYDLPETLSAPVVSGAQVGSVSLYIDGALYDIQPVYLTETIAEQTEGDCLRQVVFQFFTQNF